MAKIAVLVALYRAGQHLAGKLSDLLAQTVFDDCTIYLLNCQDLDGESEIYKDFCKLPNVVTITYGSYRKLYSTWNDAIAIGTEPFIVNANVDDRWHPQYLERVVDELERHPKVGVVMSDAYVTGVPNCIWPNWAYHGQLTVLYPGGTCGPSPVWRRALHAWSGPFEDYYVVADALMWERWHDAGVKFYKITEHLVLYYQAAEVNLETRVDAATGLKFIQVDEQKLIAERTRSS